MKKIKVICEQCGKEVYKRKKSGQKYRFCSTSCSGKYRVNKINEEWDRSGENNPAWKGGIKYALGYRFLLRPDHPKSSDKGYVQEHRLVMEEHLGRYLTDKERVHHLNGDKLDNSLDNLKLTTQGEHIKYHINNGDIDVSNRLGSKASLETRRKMSEVHKRIWKERKQNQVSA